MAVAGALLVFAGTANGPHARTLGTSPSILTNYPFFADICSGFVVGYKSPAEGSGTKIPELGRLAGHCSPDRRPIVLSVTHEGADNSHRGAANFDPGITAYMADLDPDRDLGRWIRMDVDSGQRTLSIALDTIDFDEINVTGWPLRAGHLFAAFNDRLLPAASIDRDIVLEFDLRIDIQKAGDAGDCCYSGSRIIAGAVGIWTETAPRKNRTHFFEADITQSQGYSEHYGDPRRPLCEDLAYDRCFYSPEGSYAEGRTVGLSSFAPQAIAPADSRDQVHVRLPLSQAFRRMKWASPPQRWSDAAITGVYIGLETQGKSAVAISVSNYIVYVDGSN